MRIPSPPRSIRSPPTWAAPTESGGLAGCYEFGAGVAQSYEMAFQLNLELAQAGYGAGVYYDVADAYTDGRGTSRNPEQAIYWWNRYLETGSTTFIDPDEVRARIAELEAEL